MEQNAFSDYLTERYQGQIDWYDRKARSSQEFYRWMQWSLIVLAALTPILIELDLNKLIGTGFEHLATLTAALVAILTAGLKTFNYQENWINYRATCETLRKEKYYLDAGLGEYARATDKEAIFVDRVENLISRENTIWVTAHKADNKSDGKADGT